MTPEKAELLVELLREIQKDDYYLPELRDNEAFDTVHGTFSMWAPELVITRRALGDVGPLEILLAPYSGAGKMALLNGQYHMPGGYNRMDDRSIAEICNRVAMRELGVEVHIPSPNRPLWIKWWRRRKHGKHSDEHPVGRPLSVFLEAVPVSPIEKQEWKFYPVTHLPQPMVGPCEEFINSVLIRLRR